MGYDEVLELPLKVFTLYNRSINRVRAEEEIRLLKLHASLSSSETAGEMFNELVEQMGTTVTTNANNAVPMERGAFDKLRELQKVK